uniref:Uncharacterized protein n=1 Tax=Cacopsylla melanoneura TaxID=428564 RepID=A0A8D8VM26_9HEMI
MCAASTPSVPLSIMYLPVLVSSDILETRSHRVDLSRLNLSHPSIPVIPVHVVPTADVPYPQPAQCALVYQGSLDLPLDADPSVLCPPSVRPTRLVFNSVARTRASEYAACMPGVRSTITIQSVPVPAIWWVIRSCDATKRHPVYQTYRKTHACRHHVDQTRTVECSIIILCARVSWECLALPLTAGPSVSYTPTVRTVSPV